MRLQRLLRAAAAALVFASTAVQAQAPAPASTSLADHWDGAIEIPGTKLVVDLDFKGGEGGAWRGNISIPAQGAKDLPLGSIKVEGEAVSAATSMDSPRWSPSCPRTTWGSSSSPT